MWKKPFEPCSIKVGARSSPLSRVQVAEVLALLHQHHPHIKFECTYVETYGDRDQQLSLRDLDKTDFFTREIDQLVRSQKVRVGVHSAKDLPEPLPEGLSCVAMTRGLDPSDSLVLSAEPPQKIATSSWRREEVVKRLYPQVQCVDIRGTIEQRLAKLYNKEVDGVVIAEAALIRLGLTHLKRVLLPGPTAPLQGRLAIIAHKEDQEMARLFACLNESSLATKQQSAAVG